jgi:hypothetical protein
MLEDQAFKSVLAESAFRGPKFKLAQPFLFGLSSFLYQIKPHMETIGYGSPLLLLEQCGVIALYNGLIAHLSYNDPVWDVNKE